MNHIRFFFYCLLGSLLGGVFLHTVFALPTNEAETAYDLYADGGEQEETLYQDEEYLAAVAWMHDVGLTKYDDITLFRPHDTLTREEAAKFFSAFAINVLYKEIDQTVFCHFDDLDEADPSLKNHILQGCMLHIFKGSGGYFFPHQLFTKAQGITVLVRTLAGMQEENDTYRWKKYRHVALDMGLTQDRNIIGGERSLLRYEAALLLYRAAQYTYDQETS